MNSPQHHPSDTAGRIVSWLQSVSDERSTMAELRCLLNPNLRHRGWKAVARIGGIGSFPEELLAGLFALHPLHNAALGNLGVSCKKLAAARNTGRGEDNSPLDTHFRRVLDADRSELPDILQKLFCGFRAENIPVNYALLYDDLRYWSEQVRRRWAQEYWNPTSSSKDDSSVSE